jgi:hypothetical protein
MVGQGEQPTKKTIKAIARETEEVLTRVARLEEAAADKKHNSRQDNSGSSGDGVGDGTPSVGQHSKYNRRCPFGRERL